MIQDWSSWVVGLAAAAGPYPTGTQLRHLSAGSYPIDPEGDASAPLERRWDWFFALGYDSAQLAMAALEQLPTSAATDREQVRAIHEQAAKALETVRVKLVTSDSSGFEPDHRIARQLIVR